MRSASAVSSQIRRFLSRPLNRVQHDFRSGLKMELFLNAVAERIDGGYGDVEVLGDLSRAFAMAQHSKDFECWAICRVPLPWPSIRKTSSSRSLKVSRGEAGLSGWPRMNLEITVEDIRSLRYISPPSTLRIAARTVLPDSCFITYPIAPARKERSA